MSGAITAERRTGRRFASPLSRAMASRSGLDLDLVQGSGPQGRIVRADVAAALALTARPSAKAPERATRFHDVPNSLSRKLMARRLAQAKQEAPHFYLSIDCQVDALLAEWNLKNECGDYLISMLGLSGRTGRAWTCNP